MALALEKFESDCTQIATRRENKARSWGIINTVMKDAVAYVLQHASHPEGSVPYHYEPPAPTAEEEVRSHLLQVAEALRQRPELPVRGIISSLESLAADEIQIVDLDDLDQRLTAMEDEMARLVRLQTSENDLQSLRKAFEPELRPYRGKMTEDQLAALENQYWKSALLNNAALPRLGLLYLGSSANRAASNGRQV